MPIDYEVVSGDCIDSIALRHGLFPETLWNHSSNAELKKSRKDPNVLFPGDKLFIPDIRLKQVDSPTEKKQRFRRKGVPAKLKLRFLKAKDTPPKAEESQASGDDDCSSYSESAAAAPPQEMEPIANAAFRLDVEGQITEGQSDGDGVVKVSIPPNALRAVITFYPGTPDAKEFPLALGEMDPIDTIVGARKRLCNLGYPVSTAENEMSHELMDVIGRFQQDNGLTVDGKLNDATKDKLKDKHGC